MIREKKTLSGRLLEVDYYPVIANGNRLPMHPPKHKRSTAEQERYNRNQAIKKLIRLVNANFDTGDVLMHPTYEQSKAPRSQRYNQLSAPSKAQKGSRTKKNILFVRITAR